MDSEGLKQFLKVVGDTVYNLNTICVGLESVATGSVTKSENLTVTWSTKDPKRTAISARRFAIQSSLVFVEEAIAEYIKFISKCSNQSDKVKSACKIDGKAECFIALSKHISEKEEYWLPFVVLLIRWRNKVVHNSTTNLSPLYRKIIIDNASIIKERHAAINVEETLNNFDSSKITLKDFSTIIAISIRFIRHIDNILKPTVADVDTFTNQIIERGLVSSYKNVVGVNGDEKQEVKFRSFINSNFTSIGDSDFKALFKDRYEILKGL